MLRLRITTTGYGYATVVELLSSALCEGKTSPELTGVDPVTGAKAPMPLCHFFIAIDITRFLPLENFKARTGKFLRSLRESEKVRFMALNEARLLDVNFVPPYKLPSH